MTGPPDSTTPGESTKLGTRTKLLAGLAAVLIILPPHWPGIAMLVFLYISEAAKRWKVDSDDRADCAEGQDGHPGTARAGEGETSSEYDGVQRWGEPRPDYDRLFNSRDHIRDQESLR